ncbi:MAG: hypothetical protein V1750_11110, partial [Acidobacteriota bacterium]
MRRGALALLVLLALGLAALAGSAGRARRAERLALASLLAQSGIERRHPEVAERVLRDPDLRRGRLAIARALLAESLDLGAYSRLPRREAVASAVRMGERLELAERLAAEALAERPAAWQAAMILGGARYRLWMLRGDGRLLARRDDWERPLRRAIAMAPAEDEPVRLLATALLEVWPSLAAGEQEEARGLLRRAFADPETFFRLIPLWLVAAGDRTEALALVPESTAAWRVL